MVLFPILPALLLGVVTSYAFSQRIRAESDPLYRHSRRLTALIDPFMLPAFFVTLFLGWILVRGFQAGRGTFFAYFVPLFLYIGVYYAVLLCILPLLRRTFSARACATLWLLPNLLYFSTYLKSLGDGLSLFAITLPRRWLRIILPVWGAGFLLVLLWQVVSHLRYRRYLLRDAVPVRDAELTALWDNERKYCDGARPIPMLVSGHTHTPLSIGCFSRTLRLVLPHLNYTQEEFQLIFRHEMRHIQRADTRTKAFLGFCTALHWFNPLMWIARRKVSDDLELSCDELVLSGADEHTRKRYAGLLLDTAGSGRGYTTCLSAAASSMRYRLKHIVTPRRRRSGCVMIGLALFS